MSARMDNSGRFAVCPASSNSATTSSDIDTITTMSHDGEKNEHTSQADMTKSKTLALFPAVASTTERAETDSSAAVATRKNVQHGVHRKVIASSCVNRPGAQYVGRGGTTARTTGIAENDESGGAGTVGSEGLSVAEQRALVDRVLDLERRAREAEQFSIPTVQANRVDDGDDGTGFDEEHQRPSSASVNVPAPEQPHPAPPPNPNPQLPRSTVTLVEAEEVKATLPSSQEGRGSGREKFGMIAMSIIGALILVGTGIGIALYVSGRRNGDTPHSITTDATTTRTTKLPSGAPSDPPTDLPTLAPSDPPTYLPTAAPSQSRLGSLMGLLMNTGIIAPSTTFNETVSNSPQYRALDWLANHDSLQLPIIVGDDDDESLPSYDDLVQRYALAALYYSTGGGEVGGWKSDSQWLEGVDANRWDYVSADSDTTITGLSLTDNGLIGTIPTEVGLLTSLMYLGLDDNNLAGAIPTEIGLLTRLTTLLLNQNSLTGPLPTQLGSLKNLKYIYLWENHFSGSLPSKLGLLRALTTLSVGSNKLTGSIPVEFANMASLDNIYLSYNLLSGRIPTELAFLTGLQDLYLESNLLSGVVPPFATMSLIDLTLNDNLLVGPVPTSLSHCGCLRILDLARNSLSGTLPPVLGKLTNLNFLSIESNALNGTIPIAFADLTSLTTLSLSTNKLVGSIPGELGRLTWLKELYLDYNELTGSLNPTFCTQSGGDTFDIFDTARFPSMETLVADCHGAEPQVTCDCCTQCGV